MSHNVFANNMEIAHKAGLNQVLAAFPDVCLSPPSPPAGPIPLPYPDTSMAKDLQAGTSTVKIAGKPAALFGQSFYQTSPLGDEPATQGFGGSVLTHTITGKTYFKAGSMNVKMDGKLVARHLDVTTSNHLAQEPPSTPPMPALETMMVPPPVVDPDKPKCPCCGGEAHSNQVDDKGALKPKMTEAAYYKMNADKFTKRRDEMLALLSQPNVPAWASEPATDAVGKTKAQAIIDKGNDYEAKAKRLTELRAANKSCPNVHEPPDTKCGTHFEPGGSVEAARREANKKRTAFLERYKRENPGSGVTGGSQLNHKTPLDAGGCPAKYENTIPDPVLKGPCREIETLQTALQGKGKQQ